MQDHIKTLPKEPGVYLMKNQKGTILYIGKAKNLLLRVKQYFSKHSDGRLMVPYLTAQVTKIDTIITLSEKEALLLENTLIKKHQPKYNVLLKDDKTFVSLMINHKHDWPMIRIVRIKGRPKQNALYFGPYINAYAAKQTLELMSRIFPLRQCGDFELRSRVRPCLLYDIKKCIAPCTKKCSKDTYKEIVNKAIKFLRGQDTQVIAALKMEMEAASLNLEFERANSILQTIQQIEQITKDRGGITHSKTKDSDALFLQRSGDEALIMVLFFREGKLVGADHTFLPQVAGTDEEIFETFILQNYQFPEKIPKELLVPIELEGKNDLVELLYEKFHKKVQIITPKKGEKFELIKMAEKNAQSLLTQEKQKQFQKESILLDLQESLHLTRCPVRIECFDTSSISGSDLVAAMITYIDGKKESKYTRYFIIKNANSGDDYGALQEVLTRHYTKAKEKGELPDCTIIDGGKGQLGVAMNVFKSLDIATVDLMSFVKEQGRHDKGLTKERVYIPHKKEAISFSPYSPSLHFLQRVRDDTHNSAILFHKKRRNKRVIKSALSSIPGIGPIKQKRLLTHFGSVKQLMQASPEEILKVPGITKKDAMALLQLARKREKAQN
ncbi:MAG: excinuclease ABC subunit UvrC [Simkaniaceae bacterium]|nr:excinuclease ABC subunit UvrC [Simkaniaceae bacterium]